MIDFKFLPLSEHSIVSPSANSIGDMGSVYLTNVNDGKALASYTKKKESAVWCVMFIKLPDDCFDGVEIL
jgi:hypothetical protein